MIEMIAGTISQFYHYYFEVHNPSLVSPTSSYFNSYLFSRLFLHFDIDSCHTIRYSLSNFSNPALSSSSLFATQCCLISVGDVEEAICIFSLLIYFAHQGVSFQKVSSIHKEIERSCLWKLDSLSDDVVEVIGREIIWDKVP